jgi:hypothetical protein
MSFVSAVPATLYKNLQRATFVCSNCGWTNEVMIAAGDEAATEAALPPSSWPRMERWELSKLLLKALAVAVMAYAPLAIAWVYYAQWLSPQLAA